MRILFLLAVTATLCPAQPDLATKRWWAHVEYLASDALEGRDTGSAGHRKAVQYMVEQLKDAGLRPAGEKGFLQTVPLQSVWLPKEATTVKIVRPDSTRALRFLHDVSITPRPGLPELIDAPLLFAGYGVTELDNLDAKGRAVVFFNALPKGVAAADRARAIAKSGAAASIAIDNPRALEAPRWPVAYAKAVSLAGSPVASGPMGIRLSADAADALFDGSGHSFAEILEAGSQGLALPTFPLPARIKVKTQVRTAAIESDNVIAVLPGTDPQLAKEYLVVSAHSDGYGIGEPVNGDAIYNGAFDDAAYVATLLELARHKSLRRSLLFVIVTGEEKGLLGSAYFTAHPTVPKESMAANINLDYLRPLFPLRILTTLGLDESSLGSVVQDVAKPMGIEIRKDNEPERGLFRRSDQYNFLRIGVPAVAFIFGYDAGSPEEKIYRAWYADRYHKPADDIHQPVDFAAAAKFNQFFVSLVEAVGNATQRPAFRPGSAYAPK